ncbi:MAG: ACT domain-containing protein [Eubacteriales bacterium]|nr:ACT domain-containing protein [Eubacteriales bacterium]
MNDSFYIVKKEFLPPYFAKVVAARKRIEKDGLSITDACKAEGISRSVYYKYKEAVYLPEEVRIEKKAILSFKVEDKKGVLTSLLNQVSEAGANVLTIFQDTPIAGLAYITLKIDFSRMNLELGELLERIRALPSVKKGELIAYD